MKPLDQLLFTWFDGGFRPVAATGELAKPRSWLATQTLRLCRYHAPAALGPGEEPPISYGWWTDGSTRWVFRRGHLGHDPTGRPGNFFAHLVVGHPDELPLADVAERFGSSHWWDGGTVPPPLGPVELADIPPAPVPRIGPEQLEAVLATILHGRGAMCAVLREPPAITIACMAVLCRRLPGLFDGLQFSTYEAPQHAAGFHVVGMHAADTAPRGAVTEETTHGSGTTGDGCRILISDSPEDADLAEILLAAATADGSDGAVERMAAFLPSIQRRDVDSNAIDAVVPHVLTRPAPTETLLKYSFGRRSAARFLAAGQQEAWSALQLLTPATQAVLGTELALENTGHRLSDMLGRVRSAPPVFQRAFRAAVLTSGARTRLGRLGLEDRIDLLRTAADLHISDHVVDALLGSDRAESLRLVDSRDVPMTWRGRALARLLTAGEDPTPALDRLFRYPALGPVTARALATSGPLIRLLADQPPHVVKQVVTATVDGFAEVDRRSLVVAMLARLKPAERPSELAVLFTRIRPVDPQWDAIVADAVLSATRDAVEHARPHLPISADVTSVLSVVDGRRSSALLAVIGSLAQAAREQDPASAEYALGRAVDAVARTEHRYLLATLVLAVLPQTVVGLECVIRVGARIRAMPWLDDDEFAGALLQLAKRGAVGPDYLSPLPYLVLVTEMVGERRLELTKGMVNRRLRLRNQAWQRSAADAARRLSIGDRRRAEKLAHRAGGHAEQWWLSL
ncbi:GAP1-N2 domain-containing protein [Phytoactinopolyspora halotolerans]|uniref:GTPase-associated protein 1 N-terminal domain-containing protein n=1 Tax=Phytoactinopolyspora halotolerans TaxID=1981512 RepID=A0A6L9SE41_9ACTN|nr:hypothetical protein [Phytoactinopolyspora halotolerans]NEE02771.1 hypothetical protein [Phytoactinopolyspora halotolerans]